MIGLLQLCEVFTDLDHFQINKQMQDDSQATLGKVLQSTFSIANKSYDFITQHLRSPNRWDTSTSTHGQQIIVIVYIEQ